MGATLVRLLAAAPGLELVGGTARVGSAVLGQRLGAGRVVDSLERALTEGRAEVVVDFTGPAASLLHAQTCAVKGVPLVIGSTGFDAVQRAELAQVAQRIPLVVAPNMSVGVNLVFQTAAHLARVLGAGFDVEIVETHHRMKKDAPSGTALKLAEEVARATGRSEANYCLAREGQTGVRPSAEIGIQSLRGGDVVGEHTVLFFGEGERVELTHRATSRDPFAAGALRAAAWLIGRAPGLYDMQDVLGLRASEESPAPGGGLSGSA